MPAFHATRKRRHSDEDKSDQLHSFYDLYNARPHGDVLLNQHSDHFRKVLPLPPKRTRFSHEYDHESVHRHRRRESKEQTSSSVVKPRPSARLMPCHICSSQPTRKTHLDAFAYCQGCGEWTCYICIRQCQGWRGDYTTVVSEQEALSRSFQMEDADDDNDNSQLDASSQIQLATGLECNAPNLEEWPWKTRGHQSIICRRCCVEQKELGGEVACWACHLALDAAAV